MNNFDAFFEEHGYKDGEEPQAFADFLASHTGAPVLGFSQDGSKVEGRPGERRTEPSLVRSHEEFEREFGPRPPIFDLPPKRPKTWQRALSWVWRVTGLQNLWLLPWDERRDT